MKAIYPDSTSNVASDPAAVADACALNPVAPSTHHAPRSQRVLYSQQLFGPTNEVLIEHAGFTYRLRITQANKLILTK